jgi:hypothetical protein
MKTTLLIFVVSLLLFIVSAPADAQTWSKAKMDSVFTMLDSLDDGQQVDMGLLRQAMTYVHFLTLKEGHKQYASMPAYAKNGAMAKMQARMDSLAAEVFRLNVRSSQQAGQPDLASQVQALNGVVLKHEERIGDVEGLAVAVDEEDNDTAKALVEKIKMRVRKPGEVRATNPPNRR